MYGHVCMYIYVPIMGTGSRVWVVRALRCVRGGVSGMCGRLLCACGAGSRVRASMWSLPQAVHTLYIYIYWCWPGCMRGGPYIQRCGHPGACGAGFIYSGAGTRVHAGWGLYTVGWALYTVQTMHTVFAPMRCPMCTENRHIACTWLP